MNNMRRFAQTGLALAVVGLFWALNGAAGDAGEPPPEAWALLAVGDALFVAGLAVGLTLAFHYDEHRIELVPAVPTE